MWRYQRWGIMTSGNGPGSASAPSGMIADLSIRVSTRSSISLKRCISPKSSKKRLRFLRSDLLGTRPRRNEGSGYRKVQENGRKTVRSSSRLNSKRDLRDAGEDDQGSSNRFCHDHPGDVTEDCRLARIYYSVVGTPEEREQSLKGLNSAKGYIRRELGHRMKLKYTPELLFQFDPSIEYAIHMGRVDPSPPGGEGEERGWKMRIDGFLIVDKPEGNHFPRMWSGRSNDGWGSKRRAISEPWIPLPQVSFPWP